MSYGVCFQRLGWRAGVMSHWPAIVGCCHSQYFSIAFLPKTHTVFGHAYAFLSSLHGICKTEQAWELGTALVQAINSSNLRLNYTMSEDNLRATVESDRHRGMDTMIAPFQSHAKSRCIKIACSTRKRRLTSLFSCDRGIVTETTCVRSCIL